MIENNKVQHRQPGIPLTLWLPIAFIVICCLGAIRESYNIGDPSLPPGKETLPYIMAIRYIIGMILGASALYYFHYYPSRPRG